jgi:hypothetical protein
MEKLPEKPLRRRPERELRNGADRHENEFGVVLRGFGVPVLIVDERGSRQKIESGR